MARVLGDDLRAISWLGSALPWHCRVWRLALPHRPQTGVL